MSPPAKFLKEFRLQDSAEATHGWQKVLVDQFSPSDEVDVTGVSKGKGFAGVIKRHNFRGGAATTVRCFIGRPGPLDASAFPSRVFKGMRAAGHMGQDRVTTKNLQ